MEHGLRRWMVLVLITAVSGCSLALTGPDPTRASNIRPECDTGKGLVGLDAVVGGAFGLGALSALGADAPEAAAVTALIATAFIASAARGNGVVNRCREAFTLYEQQGPDLEERPRITEDPYAAMPRSTQPPPQPRSVAQPRPVVPYPPPAQNVAPQPPVQSPAQKPPQPRPAPAADDEWSDFWTELP